MARSRGGRPRKQRKSDDDRQPDGRLRPEKIEPTRELMMHRTESLARLIQAFPVPTARKLISDPDAEWYIGRLYLAGIVTENEREAARGWREIAEEYGRLLLIPKPPGAVDMNRREPSPVPAIENDAAIARFKRVKHRYERCWDAVANCGPAVLRATTGALRDEETPVHLLREGLRALVKA